jgi:hypothetical protein
VRAYSTPGDHTSRLRLLRPSRPSGRLPLPLESACTGQRTYSPRGCLAPSLSHQFRQAFPTPRHDLFGFLWGQTVVLDGAAELPSLPTPSDATVAVRAERHFTHASFSSRLRPWLLSETLPDRTSGFQPRCTGRAGTSWPWHRSFAFCFSRSPVAPASARLVR